MHAANAEAGAMTCGKSNRWDRSCRLRRPGGKAGLSACWALRRRLSHLADWVGVAHAVFMRAQRERPELTCILPAGRRCDLTIGTDYASIPSP